MSTLKPFSGELDAPASTATSAGLQSFKGTLDGEKPKRSLWSAINDTVIEGANAAAGTASATGNFVRPGNAASQWIDKNIVEAGEAAQSDVVKAEKARYAQEMQDADGMVGEVGATLGYVARNPLLAAAQAAGSFAVPGAAIKGATTGARALGLGAKGATRAGLAAGAGVGAAGAGGDAAGTAYELSREGGATDEQAVAAARGASVIPGAIGAVGGLVGAERLVAGAGGFKGGLVSRALKTAGVEGAQEAVEEGVTQYEGQRAAVPFNPDLDPSKGVAGAATMGGVLGAATGAGASLLTRDSQAPVRKPSEDLRLDPSNGPLSKVAAAAVDEGRAAAPMQPAQPEDGLSLQPVEQPEAPATPSMAQRLEALPQQARAQADQLLREIADERTPEGVKRFRANELQQLLDANPMPQAPSMDISQEDRIAMGSIVRGFDPSTGQAPAQPLGLVDAQPQYEGGIDFEQQPQAQPSSLIQLAEWYERSAQGNRDAANPVDQVQQQVRQGTQYTDAAQVQAARQAVEDAWLSLNVGESASQAQPDGAPAVEAVPADLTAETNARLRAGRVASGVRNAFDDGAPNTLRVIQYVNQGLRTIGEQPLTSPEIARIRRLADARTAFAGLNQPAPLPADRQASPTDAAADNSSMESLIPERRAAAQSTTTQQGKSNGTAAPFDNAPQAVAPSPTQSQAPAPALPQPTGVADAIEATQAQQTGAQPQAPGAAAAEGAGQAAPAQATPVERKRSAGDLARSRSYAANPMRAFLAKHGVNLDSRSEFAPGLQEIRGTLVPGYGPMFRKSGKPLDTLVQNAVEEGFLPEGATEADLYDLIDRAVRQGERVAPMYTESAAESEFEAMAAHQAEFAREDYEADRAAQDAEAVEYEAVLAQEFAGLNDEQLAELDASAPDLDAGSNTTTEAAMRALGFSEKEIQDAVAREQGVAPEARQRGSEAVQADTRGAQARTGASQGDALQSYTEAELKQRQEAQEKAEAEAAKAEREAAAKEKTERERKEISARQAASAENFELGQDPMASLSGQASIFDAPQELAKAQAKTAPKQETAAGKDGYFDRAKALGIKGLRVGMKQDALKQRVKAFLAGERAAKLVEAGKKTDLPQYQGVPDAAVRDFAELVDANQYSIDTSDAAWVLDARGMSGIDALVEADLLNEGDAKYKHTLTPVGKEIARRLLTKPIGDMSTSDMLDEIDAGNAANDDQAETVAQTVRAAKPANRIEDVGEKIGGARKDVWTGFRDDMGAVPDEAIAAQPLSKVWPQPDYQKLIEAGHDASTVAMVRSLRDAIPTKPRQSYKVKRWAEQVKELRAFALEMMDGQLPHQKLRTELLKAGSRDLRGIVGRAQLYEAVGHGQSLEGISFAEHFYTLYKGKPNVTLWAVEQDAKSSTFGNWPRELATGDTKEQALEAFKKLHSNQAKQEAKANVPSFDIWSMRRTGDIYVGKKIGRNYAELAGPFKTVREAREYRDQHLDELTSKLEKYKETPAERADINRPRVGQDMRQGLDVTPEQFREAFGFRGVEFGNWVEQGRRQQDLNDAFDALMDMAAILQLPPKAISLNGELGLAFGARGAGGKNPAAAHYERGKVVINLTKRSGAGSLGHEWWHAVDNYFGRMRGQADGMLTEASDVSVLSRGPAKTFAPNSNVRQEMVQAFAEVIKAINNTSLRARAANLDSRRVKEYWGTDPELSARAFESYLIAKLEDQNASNDYLANVVDEKFWEAQAALGMQLENSYPYAKAGEVPVIRAAFDHFFKTVETKETDKGVAMFSRTERPTVSNTTAVQMRRAMVQRTVDALTQGWGQSPRITVVDSMNDPRVPEAVREADQAQRSQGATGEPEGFWYQGQVYLVASALPTSADATRVLYHEVLGHHGLRGHFGKDLDRVLDQVAKLRPKDVAAKAAEYGLDMGNPDHVAYAAEEVLAELAQTRPDLGFVQRAIAAIRNFLRSHVPGFKALELTDADIVQGYLLPARGWVERSGLLDAQEEAASSMEPAAQAFSRAPSVESAAFKRWYGDWQNATQGVPNNDSINLDTRGERALNTVQREGSVGAYPDGATRVGGFTFPGASGPVGRDGAPARLFHGTRDDITAFDRGAASRKDNGWLGAGFYFTSEPFIADLYSGAKQGAVGRNTMPVYVAVRNPYVASHAEKAEMKHWTRERLEQHTQALIEQGYDGVVLEGDGGVIELVAFEPTQVKSAIGNNGNYDPANPDIRYSRSQPADAIRSSMGSLTADQERAYLAVAGYDNVPTLRERFDSLKANLGLRMKQALVDQFAPIAQLDQNAYMLARMTKGSDGTLEAAMLYGRPFLRDGVPDVDVKEGGFAKVLAGLQGEHDRFLMYVAAQRAENLKAQGKENLFSDQDITSLKTLNDGQMPDGSSRKQAYAKALSQLNGFNESVLRMAKESGLIDQDAYDLMRDQPYVPFYRLMEEEGGLQGPTFSKGLTNQKAWKKLKGGSQQLNADLLQNMLLNWGNLYAASARNRAALATMDAADKMAVAYKVPSDTKGAAKVMRDGVTEHWMVEDPYLLEAISALNYQASPLMKPLAKAKQWLTWGVTVNPTFKIRNLIRDVVSSMAMADLSYNPAANVAKGWKLSASDSQIYASMLASGGVIKFGTQENADRARKQVEKLSGVMLDQNGAQKLWGQVKSLYGVYAEFGDRTENVNRVALYDRLIAKGHSHAEASFMARDLMDFSMGGSAPVVRFLTQSVPFLNARLQGLYKLGRSAKEDPRRFATVAMAVTAASLGLMAAYADDEDWKRREDWDRDSYWWFKIGETAYRIPKPFEVGAIGTLAERTAEAMFSEEMDSTRFMERIGHMVSQTFAFDPMPQAFKPLLDIYANKDSFTGRAIESQADQRLRPEDRYNERTSEVARFLGQMGLPDPARLMKGEYAGLSPKQVDHLLRAYFSWAATAVATVSDYPLRWAADRGERPDMRLKDAFLVGSFVESLPTGSSRYVSALYEQSRQVEQAFASYRDAIASGDQAKAAELLQSDGDKIRSRASVATATKLMAQLNQQAKRIEADATLSGEEKRQRLTQLEQRRHEIAQRVLGRQATSASPT